MDRLHKNCRNVTCTPTLLHVLTYVRANLYTPGLLPHNGVLREGERELDTLQQSAVAYVGAGAREEGEVLGVVSSLRTNSREICEQVRTYIVSVNCPTQRSYTPSHTTPSQIHHHTHLPLSPQTRELESSIKANLAQWSTLLDHASLFQQWLERAECEVDREYAGSTLEEAQAFCNIVMVCVGVCERQLNV